MIVVPCFVGVQDAHELALGREGHLPDPFEAALPAPLCAQLALRDEEGALGGVADDAPDAVVHGQLGVGGHGPAGQDHGDLVAQGPGQRLGVGPAVAVGVGGDLAVRGVADAGDHRGARGGRDLLDGHLRAGEGAGLVRADDRGRPEGLHAREPLDHGLVEGHALHAERQDDRQDRGQPLGHRGHGQRDPQQEGVDEGLGGALGRQEQQGGHDDDGDDDDDRPQRLGDDVDLLLQGRVLLIDGLQHAGDPAHLGAGARRRHDGPPGALGHGGAAVDHAGAVGQVGVGGDGVGGLGHGVGLAGQRGLDDAQGGGGQESGVGPHLVALAQDEDVAADQVGGGHREAAPAAQDGAGGARHLRQGGDGVGRPALLDEAEHGVEGDDGQDDERVHGDAVRALQGPGDRGDDDGDNEQVDERVLELGQKAPPGRDRRLARQLVGAVGAQRRAASASLRPASGLVPQATTTESGLSAKGAGGWALGVFVVAVGALMDRL